MLSYHMMKQSGLVEELHIDEPKLIRALLRIEAGYYNTTPHPNRWGLFLFFPPSPPPPPDFPPKLFQVFGRMS